MVIHQYGTHVVVLCSRDSSPKVGGAGGKKSFFWRPSRQPKIAHRTSAQAMALISAVMIPMAVNIVPICAAVQPESRIVIGSHTVRNLLTTILTIEMAKTMSANPETCGCRRHRDKARAMPITQTMMTGRDTTKTLSVVINTSMRQASICECAKRYVKCPPQICLD